MTLLEKIAKLEREVATLRHAVERARVGASWSSAGAVIRVGVLPSLRAVRSAVTAKETRERRAACAHTNVKWYYGSTEGKCRGCGKSMTRAIEDIPQGDPTGGDR